MAKQRGLRARGEFHIGQRVRYTKHAYDQGLIHKGDTWRGQPVPTEGVVAGFGASGLTLYVHRDNRKVAERYYVGFWEPISKSRREA